MEFTAIPVIRSACERSLQELYPAGVSLEIKERFEREMKGLEGQTEFADDLLLFKELSDAIRQACGKLYVAGMTTNSILIYLLGDHAAIYAPCKISEAGSPCILQGGMGKSADINNMTVSSCSFWRL